MSTHDTQAVVAIRADDPPVTTTEIRALADAAGYDVVGEFTQVRPEDPGTYFGAGAVEEIASTVEQSAAGTVIVDGPLTPAQNHQLQEAMARGTTVVDRYRLVLDIFGAQASTSRAQRQVELARLKYDLPRMRESSDEQLLNRWAEKGTPLYDVRDRIDRLERTLKEMPDPAEQFRARRREQGFDLVTIAGYTNAGKSTLLHRLADDMDLDDSTPDHTDKDATAAIEDRLFKTLETTTRRATLDGRPVLFTDTVGFVADLPHWLVESFSETLSEAGAADVVVLVLDASDSVERIREKLAVSLDVFDAQGVSLDDVVAVLNKVDLLEEGELPTRNAVVADHGLSPIPISTIDGTNVDRLVGAIWDRLPTSYASFDVPNCDEAMSVVSRAYDRAVVEDVTYDGSTVHLSVCGRPEVVDQLEAKADAIRDGQPPTEA